MRLLSEPSLWYGKRLKIVLSCQIGNIYQNSFCFSMYDHYRAATPTPSVRPHPHHLWGCVLFSFSPNFSSQLLSDISWRTAAGSQCEPALRGVPCDPKGGLSVCCPLFGWWCKLKQHCIHQIFTHALIQFTSVSAALFGVYLCTLNCTKCTTCQVEFEAMHVGTS